jgi:hypothetical protein
MSWAEEQDWFGLEDLALEAEYAINEIPASIWDNLSVAEQENIKQRARIEGYKVIRIIEDE